tara:strand:- start:4718 stop:6577 length:1860 start_codon:yes stop_codon:yes gene_type:complete
MSNCPSSLKTSPEFIKSKFGISYAEIENTPTPNLNPTLVKKCMLDVASNISSLPKVSSPLHFVAHEKFRSFPSPCLEDLIGSTTSNILKQAACFGLTELSAQLNNIPLSLSNVAPNALIVIGLKNPVYLFGLIKWCISHNIKQIAFVDVNIQHLYESFYLFDWEELFSRLKEHDILSTFFFDTAITTSLASAVNWFSNQRYYSATNFYYFVDRIYNSHCQSALLYLKQPNAFSSVTSMGFYEDNVNMVVNTFKSFELQPNFYLKSDSSHSRPIFLIGSGPSFDDRIDEIKYFRKKYNPLLICCGSAVTSLIENSVIPDIVVLVERNVSVFEKHRDNPQYHEFFSQIDLIAASTVDSRIFSYYKSSHIYTRSSNIFASTLPKGNILSHTHTTSANAGLSFALSLNPLSVFFYGLDFGSQSKTYTRQKYAHGIGSYKFNLAVGGCNGTMFTNPSLMRSKMFFDELLLSVKTDVALYNRSISPTPSYSTVISRDDVENILSEPFDSNSVIHAFDKSLSISKLSFANISDYINDFVPSSFDKPSYVTELSVSLTEKFGYSPEFKTIVPFIKTTCLALSCAEILLIDHHSIQPHIAKSESLNTFKLVLSKTLAMTSSLLSSYCT